MNDTHPGNFCSYFSDMDLIGGSVGVVPAPRSSPPDVYNKESLLKQGATFESAFHFMMETGFIPNRDACIDSGSKEFNQLFIMISEIATRSNAPIFNTTTTHTDNHTYVPAKPSLAGPTHTKKRNRVETEQRTDDPVDTKRQRGQRGHSGISAVKMRIKTMHNKHKSRNI